MSCKQSKIRGLKAKASYRAHTASNSVQLPPLGISHRGSKCFTAWDHSSIFEGGYAERGRRGSRGRGNDLHNVTQITSKSQGRSSSEAGLLLSRASPLPAELVHPRAQNVQGRRAPGQRGHHGENNRAIKCRPKSCLICLEKPGQPSGAVFLFPLAHFSPFHKAEFRWTSAANTYQQNINHCFLSDM